MTGHKDRKASNLYVFFDSVKSNFELIIEIDLGFFEKLFLKFIDTDELQTFDKSVSII